MNAMTKLRFMANKKARKVAYLKEDASADPKSCDDNKLVAWSSKKVAKSLLDRFFALPLLERNLKANDQEDGEEARLYS
ncbi:unnamed protein product [Cochlearia groenlandica]